MQLTTRFGMRCISLHVAFVFGVCATPALAHQSPRQSLSASEIFSRARPSVVIIFASDQSGQREVLGSGFIVKRDRITTNHHVLRGMSKAYVIFADGKVGDISGVVADNPQQDLIILAAETGERPSLPLGDDMSLQQGDAVYALGAPQGLELSFTNGIVSSFRNVNGQFLIQSTAPISHGSSGGPLFDSAGRVVGITSSLLANAPGIYFSVGVGDLKRLLRTPNPVTLPLAEWAQQEGTPQQANQQQETQPTQQPPRAIEPTPENQPQTPENGQTAATPKINPSEETAYIQFTQLNSDDYDQQIRQGEDFVDKYPQSRYAVVVYSKLTTAYYGKGQLDKMYAASDKALMLNPNNVQVLTLVGWVIPHNYDPNNPNSDSRLQKAETYEKRALQILPTLPKPAAMTDEQFEAAKAQDASMAHSGLGLAYFRQNKPQDSLTELQLATTIGKPDPVDFFIMGIDLNGLKRYDDAAQAFAECAQIPGVMQSRCKEQERKAKREGR